MTVASTTRRPTFHRLASRRVAALVTAAGLATGGVLVAGDQLTSSAAGTAAPQPKGLEQEAQGYLVSGQAEQAQQPQDVEALALAMGMTAEEAARVENDCRLRYELRLPPCVCDGDPRY